MAAALDRRRATAALLVGVACLGGLRFAYAQTAGHGSLGAWQGLKVAVTGTVVSEPEVKKPAGVAYTLTVERVNEVGPAESCMSRRKAARPRASASVWSSAPP